MLQSEFQSILLGFITQRIPEWLPEEAPEEMFLDVFQQRLKEHNVDIREVLLRNGRDNLTNNQQS